MYVVGATMLADFWEKHPGSEGPLRALHALIADAEVSDLPALLGKAATFEGNRVDVALGPIRVRMEISMAAGVARYAAVDMAEERAE